jgi:very-short-patch-repair endonuclease
VSPIIGEPARNSDAEKALHSGIIRDPKLRLLFAYNQRIPTREGSTPIVDLVWEEGKLIVEIDGPDHRRPQSFKATEPAISSS